ncbi:FtsX-like permease family protein [Leeuwenhoekiella nanhaiensis]|uniref:Cell division protein FtsX n=1 Tax=Leeuwenhoekiella nanhaiensis TaxID=1655491 RepID=A0A2G1VT35_9FLAO|nr:FtsX-like permease family protein [Leeuwenhoekiella nanhaiensis]PHQ29911.1 cell division protein FtsX [Leeuwenhoekiella nanhaiensis]
MLRNYIKIAFRNLWKNKGYSFLNISGLAIGMTAGFLILLYVAFELSYDQMYPEKDRIHRLVSTIKTPSDEYNIAIIDWTVLNKISPQFPEIETSTRVFDINLNMQKGTETVREQNVLAVDSTFLNIFGVELLRGNATEALRAPLSLVLSESAVQKYFGDQDPLGKTLKIMNGKYTAQVTGIMPALPENSQIKADMLLSISSYTQVFSPDIDESWADYEPRGYLLLRENTDAKALVPKINAYVKEIDGAKMEAAQLYISHDLEPVDEVYLYSERNRKKQGHITNVYVFSLVALFILLIAGINFVNLTTARSVERAKEVGVRKVIGAQKQQLSFQFLSESLMISLLAFVLALGLTALALPYFNSLAGKEIATGIFNDFTYIALLFGLAVLIGLLAGVYPALVLSSFKPVQVLKGRFTATRNGAILRKGLVVVQFAVSILLIIGTLVIYNQTRFMQNYDLGFAKDRLLILDTQSAAGRDVLQQQLAGNPNILSVSRASSVPGGGGDNSSALSTISNSEGNDQTLTVDRYVIDDRYLDQLDIKLLAGRNFDRNLAQDSVSAMIVNERITQMLGFVNPEDALGASFSQWGRKGEIVGVTQNFHTSSLQQNVGPLSFVFDPEQSRLLTVKVAAGTINQTLDFIEDSWQRALPEIPFDYYFLDEFFDRQYRAERQFGKLFLNFSMLAIFISCLGLLGLAAYSMLQRKREIGIRKIVGASVFSIVNLVSAEFIKLVGIAFVIAAPIAWFAMHSWLEGFAYRISLSWYLFAGAGVLVIGIALLTVSIQAIRAAVANPVKSLRTE